MSDREQWEKTFREIDKQRADARYEKDLVRWANQTSIRLHIKALKETSCDLPSLRLPAGRI